MGKKVFELAKELDMGAIDLVEKLKSMGMNVRNHMVALTDEQVEQALKELKPDSVAEAPVKKKVTKKKVAKKKVAKKVVRKRVIKKGEEEVRAPEPEIKTEEISVAPEKVEEPAKEYLKEEPMQGLQVIEAAAPKEEPKTEEKVEVSEEKKEEKKVYKEKLHTFTPVYIPPAEEKKKFADESSASSESADGKDDKRSKKRLGDLASLMSKRGAGKKDLTMVRAEEEMKVASTMVGTTRYTPAKRKRVYTGGDTKRTLVTEVKDSKRVVHVHGGCTAEELAQRLNQKFNKFADEVLQINLLVKEDDFLGVNLCTQVAELYRYKVEDKAFDEDELLGKNEKKSDLPPRNPIITVMGHVDHGKTTLLDYIRKAKVASGEAGGITQHIGAYSVEVKGSTLTFLDTPGHAAFANMRQRGANVTDMVILVVAADDGVMPQTKESIKFIKNAGVPLIVAVNKMDKESANPDRVKQELIEFEITPEEWGGDTQFVPISALKGDGVDDLLEAIQLQAEMMELTADPKGKAEGIIIEAKIEQGRGPVATVLVQKGTLKKGDSLVVGETYGRARSLMDYSGNMLKEAGPATPVQILGIQEVANPGDTLNSVKTDREAKKIVENRIQERKELASASSKKMSLEDFFKSAEEKGEKKTLNLVVRSDVLGSYEAIKQSLESLANSEVGVNVIGGGVGAITDSDVMQASASEGYIIGFNMRPVTSARRLAEQKGVDIKNYSIIYELIDEVKLALEGLLEPESVEVYVGRAQVKDTFNVPKVGTIAGSVVIDGKIERGCNIRLLRDGKIMFDGKLASLKRFKDDAKEVKNGLECGIALEGFNDVKVEDLFEAYRLEEKKRTLDSFEQLTL